MVGVCEMACIHKHIKLAKRRYDENSVEHCGARELTSSMHDSAFLMRLSWLLCCVRKHRTH